MQMMFDTESYESFLNSALENCDRVDSASSGDMTSYVISYENGASLIMSTWREQGAIMVLL